MRTKNKKQKGIIIMISKITNLKVAELHPFENNPFSVKLNEEFKELTNSIKEFGIITPITVRKRDEGGYEVISGHRRLKAAQLAGLTEIPSIIEDLDRDTAVISLVDSNLQREDIPPSEKAFAYKMKMEALNNQGKRTDLTLSQVATRLDTASLIGEENGESRDKVFRYIRLTNLIPELLEKVDNKEIATSPAVALSYLTDDEQYKLLDLIKLNDCTPSHAQALRIKKLSQEGQLNDLILDEIMSEEKPNQVENFKFPKKEIRKYFPSSYTDKQIYDNVFKALELLKRKREQSRDSR